MICKICNKEFERGYQLIQHLKKCHNMSKYEYYDTYKNDISKCKICNDIFFMKNIANHISGNHKMKIYDYYKDYDPDSICCVVCKNILSSKKFTDRLCENPNCRKFIVQKTNYNMSVDFFNLYDPSYWLDIYSNDCNKTISKLNYLRYFNNYLFSNKLNFLTPIFVKLNIDHYHLLDLINRLKNDEVFIENDKKFISPSSVNKWLEWGFNNDISTRLAKYFSTSKDMYILKNGQDKYDHYSKALSEGMKNKNYSNILTAFHKDYWIDKGMSEDEAIIHVKKQNTRNIEYFVQKYGINLGLIKYNLMIDRRKFSFSLMGHITRYGEIDGPLKYHEYIKKKIGFSNSETTSKISDIFFKELDLYLIKNNVLCDLHMEYMVDKYCVDCYIPEFDCVIEYYGDYWHSNPLTGMIFINDERSINKRSLDLIRIKDIKNHTSKVIILWEYLNIHMKEESLQKIFSFVISGKNSILELNYDGDKMIERCIN